MAPLLMGIHVITCLPLKYPRQAPQDYGQGTEYPRRQAPRREYRLRAELPLDESKSDEHQRCSAAQPSEELPQPTAEPLTARK